MELTNPSESSATNDNDDELILLVIQDKSNFPLLYDRFVDSVYMYFLSKVQNQEVAEDLTSSLFLAVFANINRYKHVGRFRAWMFTIARNLFYKHLRNPYPESIEDYDDLPSQLPIPEQVVSNKELVRLVRRFIKDQSDIDQEILRLRFISELKFSEIGLVIGKSDTATKKQYYRLIDKINRFMEG